MASEPKDSGLDHYNVINLMPHQTDTIVQVSKPGQPKALNVTHCTIDLEWSKPKQGIHNVKSYTIFYRLATNPSAQWMPYKTETAAQKATVLQLSENSTYLFKVRAKLLDGKLGPESDESEPV